MWCFIVGDMLIEGVAVYNKFVNVLRSVVSVV